MISKFLVDNGGYCDDAWSNPKFDLPYSRYESKEIYEYLVKKRNFQDADLTQYFASLPTNKIVTLKAPLLIFFINDIKKYTKRPVKVVYVNRNPQDVILSSMEKSKKSFIYYFNRIVWMYNFLISSDLPVFNLISEKILIRDLNAAKSLLDFCELKVDSINFKSINPQKVNKREPTFLNYKFSNFIWKKISYLFRVYKFNG